MTFEMFMIQNSKNIDINKVSLFLKSLLRKRIRITSESAFSALFSLITLQILVIPLTKYLKFEYYQTVQIASQINKNNNFTIAGYAFSSDMASVSQTGFKNATPKIGMKKYKKEVVNKLKKLNLTDDKEYKITVKIVVLSTGVIHDVIIIKSPKLKYPDPIKKIFSESSSWMPAKRDGALIDSEVKISVKVKHVDFNKNK